MQTLACEIVYIDIHKHDHKYYNGYDVDQPIANMLFLIGIVEWGFNVVNPIMYDHKDTTCHEQYSAKKSSVEIWVLDLIP